ncbi:MAG: RNA pseudouridine synthase [Geminicoccaceae bacterium]
MVTAAPPIRKPWQALATPVLTGADILARLLYRDAMMLIVDKPPGLPVHPGTGGGPNLEDSLDWLRFGLPQRPHLAHRLDRDTSGCLVLGRHAKALRRLGALFSSGQVKKTYWAVVRGAPAQPEGRIDLPLMKRNDKRGWFMKTDPAGQQAITDYRTLGAADGITWLELTPHTGRTHQLRVHLAETGCPILGEPIYAEEPKDLPLHLHARAVTVPLYPGRDPVAVTAEPPEHLRAALRSCGWTD